MFPQILRNHEFIDPPKGGDQMDIRQMREAARRASDLLRALGNEHRLLILCNLAEGEKSVGELQELIGLRQSALSQHLARLRHDGLVNTRRESQTIYYSLAGDKASRVIEVLYSMYCTPKDKDGSMME